MTTTPTSESTGKRARRDLVAQVVRFVVVGGLAAVVDYGVYVVLYLVLGMWYVPAKIIGWTLGTVGAYFANRRWTFQAEGGAVKFVSVMSLYGVTLVVQVGLNTALVPLFPATWFWTTAVFVVAQGTATVINFVVQRIVIFRERKPA